MNLLLDTHVAIWAVRASHLLPRGIKTLIGDPKNAVFVSPITIWEIGIKRALKRASAPPIDTEEAVFQFEAAGYGWLPVTPAHAAAVESLPLLHGDPFDRLLVAQALAEPMRLVSRDRRVAAYSDTVITW